MNIINNKILFDSFILTNNKQLQETDLNGCIAFVKRQETTLVSLAQKICGFFARKKGDFQVTHSFIGLSQKDQHGRSMIAQAVMKGVIVSQNDYFDSYTLPQILVFRPKSEKLRDIISRYAAQTAWKGQGSGMKKPSYSYMDLFVPSNNGNEVQPRSIKERISLVVADLLGGKQILDRNKEARSLICSAYATLILQGSMLVKKLGKGGFNPGHRTREQLATNIYKNIFLQKGPIADFYTRNCIMRLDGRFISPVNLYETLRLVS